MKPKTLIYDIETDGLLADCTKIHCFVGKMWNQNSWIFAVEDSNLPILKEWLQQFPYMANAYCLSSCFSQLYDLVTANSLRLVCHNQIGYDLPVLQKLDSNDWGIIPEENIIDTLVMSRYLNPDRPGHGLEWWGEELLNIKPPVEDWKNLPLQTYLHRCVEDVKITELVYNTLRKELQSDSALWGGLKLAHQTYHDMCQQERDGVVFDQEAATKLLQNVQTEMDDLAKKVEANFGECPLPASQQPTWPKKPFKKDGSLSATAISYGQKFSITNTTQLEAIFLAQTPLVATKKLTINDQVQVKAHLVNLGWKPTMWRVKNIAMKGKKKLVYKEQWQNALNYMNDLQVSPFRDLIYEEIDMPLEFRHNPKELDQITFSKTMQWLIEHGRELPTRPQYASPLTRELCENLASLESEIAKQLVRWLSLRNRQGILEGWLSNPRLKVDGRLGAGATNLANTHRQRHHTVVNVPKADPHILYGYEMRSLFIAPKDVGLGLCIGCDASALEARLAAHFAYPHDGGEYARVVLEGDTHAINAEAYSRAAGKTIARSSSKPVTFGVLYGAGGKKVARMLDVDRKIGQSVVEAFWSVNPGLKGFKQQLEKEYAKQKWYIRGLDGRRIPIRSTHALLNSAIQSAATVIMDRAWQLAKKQLDPLLYQRWGYIHDEYQFYAMPEYAEVLGKIMTRAIIEAGQYYDLNVPLAAEWKLGDNWAETH